MKNIEKISLLAFSLLLLVSCGGAKALKPTDLAVEAMERARVAEAPVYAPQEYALADDLFQQMNEALNTGDEQLANDLAQAVIEAANNATDVARQKKATALINQLKQALASAKDVGINESNPEIYTSGTQYLNDAENYYSISDYEQAINSAQEGLDLLAPVLEGQEALALANLNRARELLDRAYKTTDLEITETQLTEASNIIEQAATEYQNKKYLDSLQSSQTAISMIESLMSLYPSSGAISITINPDEENLQLQAYDYIRRLSNTIEFIKENNYTNDVYPNPRVRPLTPNNDTGTSEETINIFIEEDEENLLSLYKEEISLKAQNMQVTRDDLRDRDQNLNVITLAMIEDFYTEAQVAYDQGNYLNAVDLAREGLRLSELYLAGQTLTNHNVIRGDTLWDISRSYYNSPWLWPNIWRANKLKIKDPDLIYPNQIFKIPPAPVE